MSFELHPQLRADCYEMGHINSTILLLHKNAQVPWFILVPETQHTEMFKLEPPQQQQLQNTISEIARFIDHHFKPDKLNIATLGNVVPQLHIHIIGRFINDYCWPAPVWGQQQPSKNYHPNELITLKQHISKHLDAYISK